MTESQNLFRIHLALFVLALTLRLFFVFHYTGIPEGDAVTYHRLAQAVLEGKGLFFEGQTYSRPPVYPLFLAFFYKLGQGPRIVFIAQSILGALTCNLIFGLGWRLFHQSIGITAALLTACSPLFIKASALLLTESLFTFLLVSLMWQWLCVKERETFWETFLLGITTATAILTRSFFLLFPFCPVIYFWMKNQTLSSYQKMIKSAGILLGCILLIGLWTIRNYNVYGTWIPVSSQGGYAFYSSYHPIKGHIFGINTKDQTVAFADQLGSEVEKSRYLYQKTLEDILRHPKGTLRLEILKVLYFWAPFDWEILGGGQYHFLYGFIFPFFLLGILWAKRRRFFLLTPILYLQGVALLFYGSPRFRFPMEPFIFLLGSVGLWGIFQRVPRHSVSWVIILSFLTVNIGIVAFSIPLKHSLTHLLHRAGLW